jgi:hypothetical protein
MMKITAGPARKFHSLAYTRHDPMAAEGSANLWRMGTVHQISAPRPYISKDKTAAEKSRMRLHTEAE